MDILKKNWQLVSVLLMMAIFGALYLILVPQTVVAPEHTAEEAIKVEKPKQENPLISPAEHPVMDLKENSIQILGNQSEISLDASINLGWDFSGLPAKAGLVLNLVRDVPAADRFKYNGATGPITLQPMVVGNGAGSTTWTASQVGCAPTDFPTWCEIQPGKYYLEGTVYDRADFPILGLFGPRDPAPKVLMTLQTDSFEIKGVPDFKALEQGLEGAALNLMVTQFSLDQGGGIFSAQKYIGIDGTWFDEGAQKCLNFSLKSPFSGKIKTCGNPLKRGDVSTEVLQPLLLDSSIREYGLAKKLAENQATQPYLNRVAFRTQPSPEAAGYPGYEVIGFQAWSNQNPEATTYLSSVLRDWQFRDQAWLFAYQINKAGGSEQGVDRFNDTVWVKVPSQGLACIVAAGPQRKLRFDPQQKDPLDCLLN